MKDKDNILFATLSMHIMQLFLAALTFMAIYLGMSDFGRAVQIGVSIMGTIAIDGIFSSGLMSAVRNYKSNKLQAGVILFVGLVSLMSSQIANQTLFGFKGLESKTSQIVASTDMNADVASLKDELKRLKKFSNVKRAINTHHEKLYRRWMRGEYGLGKRFRNEFYEKIPSSDRYKRRVANAYKKNINAISSVEKKISAKEKVASQKVANLASLISTVTANEKQQIEVTRQSSMLVIKSITALNILFFIGVILLAFYIDSMGADGSDIKSIYKPFALLFVFVNNGFVGLSELAFNHDFNGDGVIGFKKKIKGVRNKRERSQKRDTGIETFKKEQVEQVEPIITDNPIYMDSVPPSIVSGVIEIETDTENYNSEMHGLKSVLKGEYNLDGLLATANRTVKPDAKRANASRQLSRYNSTKSDQAWNLAVTYKYLSVMPKSKRDDVIAEWASKHS